MKVKDLLQLDPDAEILITLKNPTGSTTTFNLETCKHIQFLNIQKNNTYVEFLCHIHTPEPQKKKRRKPEDDFQWEDATSAPSWGNYSGLN